MTKRFSKKFIILIGAIFSIILFGLGFFVYQTKKDEPTNLYTLYQGTQMRLNDISLGLNSISNSIAVVTIHQNDKTDSVTKSVTAGDKLNIYGHKISFYSINKSFIFSNTPGESQGYIKFLILDDTK